MLKNLTIGATPQVVWSPRVDAIILITSGHTLAENTEPALDETWQGID